VTWNIVPTGIINENSAPGVDGNNGKKESGYTGPCPPSGVHHYHFKVYALDTELDLAAGSDKKALEKAMQGHILAQGELVGKYKKVK
jgi:Raf kinase inhibitor-like YbhB/YbcL family protein